ncbi:LOW QUALITY PROTEIN: hypothetical protein CFOL_v3_05743, partial [Cephalotus follicularis]
CNWKLYDSTLSDGTTFIIKTMGFKPTCSRPLTIKCANSTWIAKKLEHLLRADPWISYELMEETLAKEHNVVAGYKQLYRAKTKARSNVEGNYSPPIFKRIFICYEASRRGFAVGCTFIVLDGCHLKGSYGGVLLCVIAL